MTIAMLALAGFPATAGFFGKIYLINAAVDNGYAWLGIVIVLGSAVSLAYYLRVVAAVWMRSPSEAPAPLASPVRAASGDRGRLARGRRRGPRRRPRARLGGVPLTKPDTAAVVESDFDDEPAEPHLTDARFQPEVVFVAVVVRAGHGRLRHLPRAAVQRRQGRRRSDPVADLSFQGGELSRPPPLWGVRSHPTAGQATIEYVGAIALVALVFILAAPAVGAPSIAGAVVREFKHALCIVGGDICTPGDAARAGLAPVSAALADHAAAKRRSRRSASSSAASGVADGHAAVGRHGVGRADGSACSAGLAARGRSAGLGAACGSRPEPKGTVRGARPGRARLGLPGLGDRRALPRALAAQRLDFTRWPSTWQLG